MRIFYLFYRSCSLSRLATNRLYTIVAILFYSVNITPALIAQSEVEVSVSFDGDRIDGRAIPIWTDENGSVFVTPMQLLRDDYSGEIAEEVDITLSEGGPQIKGEVISISSGLEWAILKANSPKDANWQHEFAFKELADEEFVYVSSRNGKVISANQDVIIADIGLIPDTYLGGALRSGGKIVGMVVNIEEHQTTALPIINIIRLAFNHLGLKPSQKFYAQGYEHIYEGFGIPYITVGGYMQYIIPISNLESLPLFPPTSWEFFAEASLFKPVAFRFSYGAWRIKSLNQEFQGKEYQFQNRPTIWSLDLVFYDTYNLRNDFRGEYYGIFGYTRYTSKPQLRTDGGEWTDFTTLNYLDTPLPPTGGIKLGAGASQALGQYLVFGFEMGFLIPFSNDLVYDPLNPQSPTPNKENLFSLKFGLGLRLGNKAKLRD